MFEVLEFIVNGDSCLISIRRFVFGVFVFGLTAVSFCFDISLSYLAGIMLMSRYRVLNITPD